MTESKDEEDKPFRCKQCKESFMTEDRLQVHRQNHKLKVKLLQEHTPTPSKYLESNFDPFDQFAEMRNNGGDTPATSKPRLIISPSLHTPVANLMSPVFPTNLLTSSSGAALHSSSTLDSPIFPIPKLSPVPGPITLSQKTVAGLPRRHIDLQEILRDGLVGQMSGFKLEKMDTSEPSDMSDVKQEPGSPQGSAKRQMIADRIRRRADPGNSDSDSKDSTSGMSSSNLMEGGGSGSGRKRFPSEMNGQIDEKRRKFLERNRAAAQRCREKRKQWINNLQSEKFTIQEENNKLHVEVHSLRQEIINLKRLLLQHKDCPVTKASKDGKLDPSTLPPSIVFPNVSENSDIKRPSPSKPHPPHAMRLQAPRDADSNGHAGEGLKRRITPTTSLNSDPLGPLLDGLITKDGFSRSKFSPLFNPLSNLPRSPIIGLSPFSLGPNFPNLMHQMGTSTLEPHYTITSLDSRGDKGRASPLTQENPCPDVGNGLIIIREALSNCKT